MLDEPEKKMSTTYTQTQTRVLYAEPHHPPALQKKKAIAEPKYATQERVQNELTEIQDVLVIVLQSVALPSNVYAFLDKHRARIASLFLETPEGREEMVQILEDVLFEIAIPNNLEENYTPSILSLFEKFCTEMELLHVADRRIQALLSNIQNNNQFIESSALIIKYAEALKNYSLTDVKGRSSSFRIHSSKNRRRKRCCRP